MDLNNQIHLLAQVKKPVGGMVDGMGEISNYTKSDIRTVVGQFNEVMSSIIGLLTVIAGLYFVFLLITGAISWLSAGGDKMATENAQKRITHGLTGLVIIIAGLFLVNVLGNILGLDILSPGNFIFNVWVGIWS